MNFLTWWMTKRLQALWYLFLCFVGFLASNASHKIVFYLYLYARKNESAGCLRIGLSMNNLVLFVRDTGIFSLKICNNAFNKVVQSLLVVVWLVMEID